VFRVSKTTPSKSREWRHTRPIFCDIVLPVLPAAVSSAEEGEVRSFEVCKGITRRVGVVQGCFRVQRPGSLHPNPTIQQTFALLALKPRQKRELRISAVCFPTGR